MRGINQASVRRVCAAVLSTAVMFGCGGTSEDAQEPIENQSVESIESVSQALSGQIVRIAAGSAGTIYAMTANGNLLWFKDLARNGTSNWHPNSGKVIGTGWNICSRIVSAGEGILYCVRSNGNLTWYRDVNDNGLPGWHANSGAVVGSGWNVAKYLAADNAGWLFVGYGTSSTPSRFFVHQGRYSGQATWTNPYGEVYAQPCASMVNGLPGGGVGGYWQSIYAFSITGTANEWLAQCNNIYGGTINSLLTAPQANTWTNDYKIAVEGSSGGDYVYVVGVTGDLSWYRTTPASGGSISFQSGSGSVIYPSFALIQFP